MLDPAIFRDYPDLVKGDNVKFKTTRQGVPLEGTGVVLLIWMGIAEMCKIGLLNGETIDVCRDIGDVIEKVDI